MASIIPQSVIVNQKTWVKLKKWQKFDYNNLVSINKYEDLSNKIGNDIVIST